MLELGACIGVLSCITNSRLKDPSQHVIVEANSELIPYLELNRNQNNCRFSIENCLVSRTMDGTFYLHDMIVSSSAERKTGREIRVPVRTVEEISQQSGIQFDTLIMDIEGGELAFLSENQEFVRSLKLAIIEFHDFMIGEEKIAECRKLLSQAGLVKADVQGSVEVWIRQ